MKKALAILLIVILVSMQIPAFALSYKATVVENDVRLRDSAGNYLVTIPKGMKIEVQRYDKYSDMFYVVCEKSILRDGNSVAYREGYIKGTGLNIARDQLINIVSTTPSPTKKPTAKPTVKSTATLAPTATPKPIKTASFGTVGIGDIITFGKYEQDGIESNGNELIEWIILDIQENKALILSKYALDCKEYNAENRIMSWEECTLRAWLNDMFLNSAFSKVEQEAIVSTTIDNSKNQSFNGTGSNDTQDKVFLLSYTEAYNYFSVTETRKCLATNYANQQGARLSEIYKINGEGACRWWLRTPGVIRSEAECIDSNGSRICNKVNISDCAIRPALWINLKSSVLTRQIPENLEVGDSLTLGVYEQDNDKSNGAEPIEWDVVAVNGNKALVVSSCGIDVLAYGNANDYVEYQSEGFSWQNSALRSGLNEKFYSSAFSQEEQKQIAETTITTNDVTGNFTTVDKIFILSKEEANQYYTSSSAMSCMPSGYTKTKLTMPGYIISEDGYASWWLRDMTSTAATSGVNEAAQVQMDGGIAASGVPIFIDNCMMVRPAMWISFGAEVNAAIKASSAVPLNKLKTISEGDLVTFGHYEQDNDLNNGTEDITWVVLNIENDNALLISYYALNMLQFSQNAGAQVSWAGSAVRSWLSSSFMNEAFDKDDRARILMTAVDNSSKQGNPIWNNSEGATTFDFAFLLSYAEVQQWLPGEYERTCMLTEYAKRQGIDETDSKGNNSWWLRSQGSDQLKAAVIDHTGKINDAGANDVILGVRPAIWIKLNGIKTATATPKPTKTPTPKPTKTPTPKPTAKPTQKPSTSSSNSYVEINSVFVKGFAGKYNFTANDTNRAMFAALAISDLAFVTDYSIENFNSLRTVYVGEMLNLVFAALPFGNDYMVFTYDTRTDIASYMILKDNTPSTIKLTLEAIGTNLWTVSATSLVTALKSVTDAITVY